jgi:hypothetical protein
MALHCHWLMALMIRNVLHAPCCSFHCPVLERFHLHNTGRVPGMPRCMSQVMVEIHCCSCPAPCRKAATTKYTGPVPIVTHVHGTAGVQDNSDGYTEAWYLPDAVNIAGYAKVTNS